MEFFTENLAINVVGNEIHAGGEVVAVITTGGATLRACFENWLRECAKYQQALHDYENI